MTPIKRLILIAFSIIPLISCRNITSKERFNQSQSPQQEFTCAAIQAKINESAQGFNPSTVNFPIIKEHLLKYTGDGIIAIPIAANVVSKYIDKLSNTDKDSLFILFSDIFYKAADVLTDSLESAYPSIIQKVEKNIEDKEVKDFKKSLDICGLSLLTTEGIYYVDARYDYFYNLFHNKISPAMDEYLKIRKKELKEGYSEDAGLLISFESLYQRVVTWENFSSRHPDFFLKQEALNYYASYFSVLLTGMDNSRTFDIDTDKLLPEIQKLYEKIISQNLPNSSTRIIREYYDLLKANGFKQLTDISQFLKKHQLYCMLGVQPDTR